MFNSKLPFKMIHFVYTAFFGQEKSLNNYTLLYSQLKLFPKYATKIVHHQRNTKCSDIYVIYQFSLQDEAVFNLENFKGGCFHLTSNENKAMPHISPFT